MVCADSALTAACSPLLARRCSQVRVTRPEAASFAWVDQWDEDEGANHSCAESRIAERHNDTVQTITWDITVPQPYPHAGTASWLARLP